MYILKSNARAERGASRLPFLAMVALIAVMLYVAVMFIPTYVRHRNLTDDVEEIVRRGALQKLSDLDVTAQLREKVREYGVPKDNTIELTHEGKGLTASIRYTHTVPFAFFTYRRQMEIKVKNYGF